MFLFLGFNEKSFAYIIICSSEHDIFRLQMWQQVTHMAS